MANTSIVTESARAAAAINVEDFAESVRAHINQGWEAHHQVGLVYRAFPIPLANVPADQSASRGAHEGGVPPGQHYPVMLRLQVTHPTTGNLVAVLVPVVGVEEMSAPGTPSAPEIDYATGSDTRLAAVALELDEATTLEVALSDASSINPTVYQWRKDGINISGANTNQLVVTMSSAANAGDYQCAVANFGGMVLSEVAQITLDEP